MNADDNPYKILGVAETATPAEIRTAYRKLALKHHPDKQTAETKEQANALFAKISNAYELLSDEEQRRAYDNRRQTSAHSTTRNDFSSSTFTHPFDFRDPFQVFAQAFHNSGFDVASSMMGGFGPFGGTGLRSGFGGDLLFGGMPSMMGGFGVGGSGMMMDPFAGMMGGGGMMMGGGGMMMGAGSMMGGMNSMFGSSLGGGMSSQQFTFSSSSSSSSGFHQTTTTTTTSVNGRTITERVVQHADGSVERAVQDSASPKLPAIQPDTATPTSKDEENNENTKAAKQPPDLVDQGSNKVASSPKNGPSLNSETASSPASNKRKREPSGVSNRVKATKRTTTPPSSPAHQINTSESPIVID